MSYSEGSVDERVILDVFHDTGTSSHPIVRAVVPFSYVDNIVDRVTDAIEHRGGFLGEYRFNLRREESGAEGK